MKPAASCVREKAAEPKAYLKYDGHSGRAVVDFCPMITEHELHTWLHRPPPSGASIWVDRLEKITARGIVYPLRRPAFFNLGFVLSGEFWVQVGEDEARVGPSDLFAFWPGKTYSLRVASSGRGRFYRLRLRGNEVRHLIHALGLPEGTCGSKPCHAPQARRTMQAMARLYRCAESREANRLLSLLYAFAGAVRPNRQKCEEEAAGAVVVARAISLMEGHFKAGLSIPDLAAALSVSESTLQRLFRTYQGETPLRALNRIRLLAARELLCTTDRKVEAIARAAGFPSEKYFYRSFKDFTGDTPADHRRRNRRTLP